MPCLACSKRRGNHAKASAELRATFATHSKPVRGLCPLCKGKTLLKWYKAHAAKVPYRECVTNGHRGPA